MHCKSYSHFFSKKFQHICVSLDINFNESLTNDIVSFEQLGREIYVYDRINLKCSACWVKYAEDEFLKYFPQKTGLNISHKLSPIETIDVKCQILFSGKNKKNAINISSAEFKVKATCKIIAATYWKFFLLLFFQQI